MGVERQQNIDSNSIRFNAHFLFGIVSQIFSKYTAQPLGRGRCCSKLSRNMTRNILKVLMDACFAPSVAACGNKVDPVYETLRFGTSLAQKTKKGSSGSGSDSPNRNSVSIPHLSSVFSLEEQQIFIHMSLYPSSQNLFQTFKKSTRILLSSSTLRP